MHQIRFIPKTNDPDDPIVRLRCDMIIDALSRFGYDAGRFLPGDKPDILVSASIDFSGWWALARRQIDRGVKVVFDLSENEFRRRASLFADSDGKSLAAAESVGESFKRGVQYLRRRRFDRRLEKVVAGSSHVAVSSEDIARSVSRLTPNVTVIYEPIDPGYPETPKIHRGRAQTLVWIGMPVNFMYIEEIRDVLTTLMDRENVRLKIITSEALFSYYPELPEGDPVRIQWVRWRLDSLWRDLDDADIGIAPLFWYPWKSPNKVVTYWAAGLPVVAGRAPAYEQWVAEGKDGFVAGNRDQWFECILRLIRDPELRNRLGQSGYEKAVKHFSLDAVSASWRSLFDGMLTDRKK